MQITNSFINKHCERIKCAAYAGSIKEAFNMGQVISGKGHGGVADSNKCALALSTM